MKRWLLRIAFLFLALLLFMTGGFVLWAEDSADPSQEALDALVSDEAVVVETDRWIIMTPRAGKPTTGFIFYPGGRVDARAYAPALHAIASEGYLVIIVPMPLNLAALAPGRAEEVIADFPQIEHWAIGGHSLGAAMAANFVYSYPGLVDGLVLWAGYPADSNSLADQNDLAVVSIYGTLDGLARPGRIDRFKPFLPADTQYVAVEGGNHAQFGYYGEMGRDGTATLSHDEQTRQTVEATLALLATLGGG